MSDTLAGLTRRMNALVHEQDTAEELSYLVDEAKEIGGDAADALIELALGEEHIDDDDYDSGDGDDDDLAIATEDDELSPDGDSDDSDDYGDSSYMDDDDGSDIDDEDIDDEPDALEDSCDDDDKFNEQARACELFVL
jgi:hypothetical protein